MRLMIKWPLLRKYKYPPDEQEEATALVLKQAEALEEGGRRGGRAVGASQPWMVSH